MRHLAQGDWRGRKGGNAMERAYVAEVTERESEKRTPYW